ncbi:KN motif and ankyrin repeat domain-containing protein 1b [Aulostomus maculatus]
MLTRTGYSTEECLPNSLETDYSYQLDLDSCVDSFHNSGTIKRLSLKRRPRVAVNNVDKTQAAISTSQWHSAESLSAHGSDDTRLLGMSSTTRGRPPLPPPHGSSSDKQSSRNEGLEGLLTEFKPQPAARSLALQRQSPVLEKTIVESHQNLEQEATSHPPPQPSPRRRLASFGGVSSPGSRSPFTGLGVYNQSNNGNRPDNLSSALGGRGSTGCLRQSPPGSGRSTPVSSLGSSHLQNVRDQMVVALQRLKELEEQVKIIPILQVKISVLQEEKRQLASQLKNQSDNRDINDVIWKTAYNAEAAEEGLEAKVQTDGSDFREFRQLSEQMQALERTIKGGHLHLPPHNRAVKPVAVETGKDKEITSKMTKENKYVYTEQVDTRSIAIQVTEDNLGTPTERDAESSAQQLIIGAMKERICHLEAELKESALQTEMSLLKLELQAAGARNRADKASFARPSTTSTGTEARPDTINQGVGNHTELRDASTGDIIEVKTVGVSCCRPELRNASTGPDQPMSYWEVRERVETREKGVGVEVLMNTQGVGMEIKVCDAECNTEEPLENLVSEKKCHSVACGDCSIDVIISEAKEMVSRGSLTDPVKGIDLGIMASPQTASQRTNTVASSVSRFTNTRHAFNTESSTNTVLNTQDKHTNTPQAVTRTVSVGSRVKDIKCFPETRTIGVGTSNLEGNALKPTLGIVNKITRDTGVGFTNINDNFLVGLKTRNMASGPSHLPDPIKTRSIGVGEGKIQDFSGLNRVSGQGLQQHTQPQWDPELNHYIEKMQRLLGEHGDLVTEDGTKEGDVFVQQHSSQGRVSSPFLTCSNKNVPQGGRDVHAPTSQPSADRERHPPPQLSLECDKANPGCQQGSNEVQRMIHMLELQTSSAVQERSANSGVLHNVMKKHHGDQSCSSTRKSMRFLKVSSGLEPTLPLKPTAAERVSSEEVKGRGTKKLKEASQGGTQARQSKGGTSKGAKGSAKSHAQQGCKLSEKMFSACQVLKMHLSDDTAVSREALHDCLQTIQQEWFSVSSHKSAACDSVNDCLSAFRVISPSVLQHVANMADGNGNTALHYCVSHSNFGVVKKLLDAEVCNVNQQNKAGYTPIMLAALAAVERPEDMRVVEQLFTKGDVNAKASQAGQTALMLAVSHGRIDMVKALLAQGAETNLQDDEGSTALMCASEHGHADIVKLLLAQPDCDATLTDSDESTALSIALEAGHNDIAVLLYAHANFSKGLTAAAAHLCGSRSIFE